MPRIAPTLYEFVEADDGEYLKVTEAVLRIFDRQDWLRVNRARARIKVFVDKFGIDELRRQVDEELQGDWVAERDFDPAPLLFVDDEEAGAPGMPGRPTPAPTATAASSSASRATNVRPQRQAGFSTVEIKVIRGDLTPEQFRGLAEIMRDYSGGYARTTVHQNLVLRWVRDETRLRGLAGALASSASATPAPTRSTTWSAARAPTPASSASRARWGSTTRCASASSRWTSPTRSRARVHIKMSGCPNGCSQHHIANIGFYGASIKVGEHTIPAYVAHIGGNYEGGEVVYGTRLKVRLAAKRVPEAVERWLRMYEAEREEGEAFNAFAERVGTHPLRGRGARSGAADRVLAREHEPLHRLAARRALPGHPG